MALTWTLRFTFLRIVFGSTRFHLTGSSVPAFSLTCGFSAGRGQIEPEHLTQLRDLLRQTRKVVIKTGWYKHWGELGYFTDFPVVSGAAAEFLVECGVQLFGIDTPSVDDPPFPAHLVLLGNDVVIVENLTNLDAVDGDLFQLVVLPLKITGREASPARAIAMPVNS